MSEVVVEHVPQERVRRGEERPAPRVARPDEIVAGGVELVQPDVDEIAVPHEARHRVRESANVGCVEYEPALMEMPCEFESQVRVRDVLRTASRPVAPAVGIVRANPEIVLEERAHFDRPGQVRNLVARSDRMELHPAR